MKLMKYTFRTPLFGSIDCEELLSNGDDRIELSPEQMYMLSNAHAALSIFLNDNNEDLAESVPDELKNVVLRAEFGDHAVIEDKLYLMTHIWAPDDLTDSALEVIQEWITGQMSDGWGEGLEQKGWMHTKVDKPLLYFDEYTLQFEEDYETYSVSYYVHPWHYEDFTIELDNYELVEEDTNFEIVATMALPYHSRQVLKFPNSLSLKMFLKDSCAADLEEYITDIPIILNTAFYLVRDLDGPSGIELLPKWVCVHAGICFLYEITDDQKVESTKMTISKAILELLK